MYRLAAAAPVSMCVLAFSATALTHQLSAQMRTDEADVFWDSYGIVTVEYGMGAAQMSVLLTSSCTDMVRSGE